MGKFKKVAGIGMSVVLTALALSGCSGSNSPAADSGSNDTNKPAEQETITLMTNDVTLPGWKEYQKKIEDVTGVKINAVGSPSNPDDRVAKMTTILSSGDNSVDILHVNDELITAFSRARFLEPLEKDIMTPENVKNFPEQYVKDMIIVDKNIYSVPTYLGILAFWVNHELLKQANMKVPTNKEEFLAYAKAVTKNGVFGYGGSWEKSYVFNEIGTFINLFGGDYYDWNNPKTREALQFMYDLANKDKVTPIAQLADIYDPLNQKFIDGKYGMMFMYTGSIQKYVDAGKFNPNQVQIEPMPTFATNNAYMSSWHYVLNKSSKKKEAAKKVLNFAVSKEGQLAYSKMSARIPTRLDVLNDPSFNAPGLDSVKKYLQSSTLRGRPLVPQTMEFVNGVGGIFQKYVTNAINLDEAAAQANKEVQRLKK